MTADVKFCKLHLRCEIVYAQLKYDEKSLGNLESVNKTLNEVSQAS